MAKELSLADILVNRQAVSLARSQRVIQSWLPQRAPAESTSAEQAENDSDFEPESEIAGVGSKRKAEDDEGVLGGLKRRRVAADDRLLEQLLGKKGAQAARKGQEGSKVPAHTAAKPLAAAKKEAKASDNSDTEDAGRAASFKSRKPRAIPARSEPTTDEPEGDSEDEHTFTSAPTASPPPSSKRPKTNSYLDELLGQKAAKKKSKKKKKPVAADT